MWSIRFIIFFCESFDKWWVSERSNKKRTITTRSFSEQYCCTIKIEKTLFPISSLVYIFTLDRMIIYSLLYCGKQIHTWQLLFLLGRFTLWMKFDLTARFSFVDKQFVRTMIWCYYLSFLLCGGATSNKFIM